MCEERDRITAIVRVQRPKQGRRRSEARADVSHPRAYRIVIVLAPLNVPLCPALCETGDMAGDTTSSAGWFTSTRSERTLNFYLLHFIFAYVCINWRHTLHTDSCFAVIQKTFAIEEGISLALPRPHSASTSFAIEVKVD